MGRILSRAIGQAGLSGILERVLSGEAATSSELARLRTADVLLVAGMADLVRERFFGDEVRVLSTSAALADAQLVRLGDIARVGDATGQEQLFEVALARLATPGRLGVAIGLEGFGLQLAQVALSFGANVLFGDFGASRGLPVLEGGAGRRAELTGLLERAGRRVRWDEPRASLELGGQP